MPPTQVSSQLAFRSRKTRKIDVQDGRQGATILAIFGLLVTQMLPTKFRVKWSPGSGEEAKIDFQDGGHVVFPIETILASFNLLVTPILPTKSRVNWPKGVGQLGFLMQLLTAHDGRERRTD